MKWFILNLPKLGTKGKIKHELLLLYLHRGEFLKNPENLLLRGFRWQSFKKWDSPTTPQSMPYHLPQSTAHPLLPQPPISEYQVFNCWLSGSSARKSSQILCLLIPTCNPSTWKGSGSPQKILNIYFVECWFLKWSNVLQVHFRGNREKDPRF